LNIELSFILFKVKLAQLDNFWKFSWMVFNGSGWNNLAWFGMKHK